MTGTFLLPRPPFPSRNVEKKLDEARAKLHSNIAQGKGVSLNSFTSMIALELKPDSIHPQLFDLLDVILI